MTERYLKYLFKRGTAVCVIILLLLLISLCAVLLPEYSADVFVFPWPILGDATLPLALFLCALIFRSRVCSVLAILSAFAIALLRLVYLVLYREAFIPLTFQSLLLLCEHTDHASLTAVLGDHYLLWLVPLLMAGCAGVTFCCIGVWHVCQKKRRELDRRWLIVFSVLLGISVVFNVCYYWSLRSRPRIYNGPLVRPLSFVAADFVKDWRGALRKAGRGRIGFFPEKMAEESKEYLLNCAVFPSPDLHPDETEGFSLSSALKLFGGELPGAAARFDKVVIVALESLDRDFIGALAPAGSMPPGITPTLDRLVTEHPSLLNYYTAAQPTSWGLNALLLSRLDYARDRRYAGNESLFSIANGLGFYTAYFSPTVGSFGDNRRIYGELFKPKHLYFLEEWMWKFGWKRNGAWGITDDLLYQGVLKVLRRDAPQKFLILISTLDTHPPYTVSGPEAETSDFGMPFLNALHCCDRNLGDFLRAFMADPTLYDKRTLIVVTADHSATHGANYLHRRNFSPSRIPLIFITPDDKIFRSIPRDKFASSIDLAPTLVRLIGGRVPHTFMGRDLREDKDFAVSRTMDDLLILRDGRNEFQVDLTKERPETMPERAYYDFFRLYYE